MRLQVFLSRNGVCSRRKAFDLIQLGKVNVNGGRVTEPSLPVDPAKDKISVSGKIVEAKNYDYVLLNKPAGFITTRKDRFAEKIVFDLLPKEFAHLVPVGCLDQDTQGLLLLSNDGDMVYRLTHPSFNIDKVYLVQILGKLDAENKAKIENGVMIDGQKTSPAKIKDLKFSRDKTELTITIHEGRKRQVRRMFEKFRLKVIYLKRLSQGPLSLGSLKVGQWRKLDQDEISLLRVHCDKND